MKNHILAVTLLLLCSFIPSVSKAQGVAHVNYQEVVELMPDYKLALNDYEVYREALNDQLMEIQNNYLGIQKKAKDEAAKPVPNEARLKIYYSQMETAQLQYQTMQESIQDSLSLKQMELLQPIKDKVTAAVAEIAKEKGYTHVLDNANAAFSGSMLLYADPAYDITALVKAKLGLKEKPTANPGAGKPKTLGTGK